MDCNTPGSSVHGISQTRILEWVAISSSRGTSQPRDWSQRVLIYRTPTYIRLTVELQINNEHRFFNHVPMAPIRWPPDVKSWLIGKDPDAGKDGRQEEKGATKDEMVGWHHQCNGHELGQTPGDGVGQGSLACSSPWGCKELNVTWQLTMRATPFLLRDSCHSSRYNGHLS